MSMLQNTWVSNSTHTPPWLPLTVLFQAPLERIESTPRTIQSIRRSIDGRIHLIQQFPMQFQLVAHAQSQLALALNAGAQQVQVAILYGHFALLRSEQLGARLLRLRSGHVVAVRFVDVGGGGERCG